MALADDIEAVRKWAVSETAGVTAAGERYVLFAFASGFRLALYPDRPVANKQTWSWQTTTEKGGRRDRLTARPPFYKAASWRRDQTFGDPNGKLKPAGLSAFRTRLPLDNKPLVVCNVHYKDGVRNIARCSLWADDQAGVEAQAVVLGYIAGGAWGAMLDYLCDNAPRSDEQSRFLRAAKVLGRLEPVQDRLDTSAWSFDSFEADIDNIERLEALEVI